MMREKKRLHAAAVAGLFLLSLLRPADAQQDGPRRSDSSNPPPPPWAGRSACSAFSNFALTGFGQRAYMDGGGNVTGDVNAPAKWQGVIDAQRTFDLRPESRTEPGATQSPVPVRGGVRHQLEPLQPCCRPARS